MTTTTKQPAIEPSLVSDLRRLADLLLALSGNESVRELPAHFDKEAFAANLEKLLESKAPRVH